MAGQTKQKISKDQKGVTVGLLWHSANSANLGIGALTVSHIGILKDICCRLGMPVRFKIFQWTDSEPDYVNGPDVETVRLRARHLLFHPYYLSRLRSCDLVLDIGAGDSFADIYGLRRFAFMALSKLCVLIVARPLILAPQTIGPFTHVVSRTLAGFLIRACRAVVTRDELSSEFVRQFNLGQKLVEATDVAFRLPFERQSESR